jgi:hypothetical protein
MRGDGPVLREKVQTGSSGMARKGVLQVVDGAKQRHWMNLNDVDLSSCICGLP